MLGSKHRCSLMRQRELRRTAGVVLLSTWLALCVHGVAAAGSYSLEQAALQQALESTTQYWNQTSAWQLHELHRVLDLAHQLLYRLPGTPKYVPELHVPDATAFLAKLLREYPLLTGERLGSWSELVTAFLNKHITGRVTPATLLVDPSGGTSSGGAGAEFKRRNRKMQGRGRSAESVGSKGAEMELSVGEHAGLTGLPLVRRVLTAQVLLSWMGPWGRQLPPGFEATLGDIVNKFYGVHASSVARRGMMEYLHISKAGGTSFSEVAKRNGCAMHPYRIGMVPGLADNCRWVNKTAMQELLRRENSGCTRYGEVKRSTKVQTCAQRAALVSDLEYVYVSNEYTLHGGVDSMQGTHPCPQFVNVVTLREPHERIRSHLKYHLVYWARSGLEDRVSKGGPKQGQLLCSNWKGAQYPPGLWDAVMPGVADNYMTRSFLGELGFHTPVGSITSEHMALARALLLQFDMVLDLNAGQQVGDTLLQQGLGWSTTMAEVHARTVNGVSERKDVDLEYCDPAGLDEILAEGRQAPDQDLYRFGVALNRLDFLFLEVARSLGLVPEAAGDTGSGDRASSGASLARDGDNGSSAGVSLECGMIGRPQGGGGRGGRGEREEDYDYADDDDEKEMEDGEEEEGEEETEEGEDED